MQQYEQMESQKDGFQNKENAQWIFEKIQISLHRQLCHEALHVG